MAMSQKCLNCQMSLYKLSELVKQYEHLLLTKEQQIICSHRIISELQNQLSEIKQSLTSSQCYAQQLQKNHLNTQKIITQKQQTIGYLKQRQIQLLQQIKCSQKQIFKLEINAQDIEHDIKEQKMRTQKQNNPPSFVTPKKTFQITNSGNVTMNKDRQNNTIDRLFQESTIRVGGSEGKQMLKLQVTEDKLNLMNIKYKMALLKTVQIATLK